MSCVRKEKGENMGAGEQIEAGQTALGIEFGSTRIKAVLIDLDGNVLGTGVYDWENKLRDGIWTYSYEEIDRGLRGCYTSLRENVRQKYGVVIRKLGALGISAMMHGYIALDQEDHTIAPFQTWRNTNTQAAADEMTELFDFNIPLRWTSAHLYQCVLDHEKHLDKVDFVTTLASYMHYRLTGRKVTGAGDASGIFPMDTSKMDYDAHMMELFDGLLQKHGYSFRAEDLFPKVLYAGEDAGTLTAQGAALLDESGNLEPGVPMAPPEGDAGTGMVSTNSVAPGTGNISAGTSTFAMIVLEKGQTLKKLHREIDMVTTPDGAPCAMSHANNGTTDLNAWVGIFHEFCELMGIQADMGELYQKLYTNSLKGDPDCGGLLAYGYYSGENVTMLNEGRPLYVRMPDSRFNLANLMRANLYTSLAAVKLGMDILKEENVHIDRITGHGGLFKTEGVAQKYLAAAIHVPVTVMKTASEGGPWGMAVLAAYRISGANEYDSLGDYLSQKIFAGQEGITIDPDPADEAGYETFAEHYRSGIAVEKAAIDHLSW